MTLLFIVLLTHDAKDRLFESARRAHLQHFAELDTDNISLLYFFKYLIQSFIGTEITCPLITSFLCYWIICSFVRSFLFRIS